MPWKNQGGGPWGSGPKGPWGSGPQPTGPRPPDLEDLLRRGQARLQQILPGGYFSGMGIALILIGALAIWGLSGFFRVQPDELGVVLRFGKHVRTVQPGRPKPLLELMLFVAGVTCFCVQLAPPSRDVSTASGWLPDPLPRNCA